MARGSSLMAQGSCSRLMDHELGALSQRPWTLSPKQWALNHGPQTININSRLIDSSIYASGFTSSSRWCSLSEKELRFSSKRKLQNMAHKFPNICMFEILRFPIINIVQNYVVSFLDLFWVAIQVQNLKIIGLGVIGMSTRSNNHANEDVVSWKAKVKSY